VLSLVTLEHPFGDSPLSLFSLFLSIFSCLMPLMAGGAV